MTKTDIVEEISKKHGLYRKESADLVNSVFKLIGVGLENGDSIKISGFGRFEVKQKNARQGRNPHTGATITITPRRVLAFKPSELLRSSINAATSGSDVL